MLAAIGEVRILDAAGQSRAGERGDALATGERVAVGANGLAQLRFSDGGLVSLRANSELSIDAYAYQGERDTAASSVLQLVRGGLRAITGAIARLNRGGYTVVTTNATIGVRGTDFEVFHISPPVPSGETLPGEPGTYLKVNQGTAFLQTQGDHWTFSRSRSRLRYKRQRFRASCRRCRHSCAACRRRRPHRSSRSPGSSAASSRCARQAHSAHRRWTRARCTAPRPHRR
ncbi:MAG: FecR family protein [Burkholderiales bacterium]|nr:FecR family protein [Burkholderiales bacterium]